VLIVFLVGVILVLWGVFKSLIADYTKGIWFSGIGTVLAVLALFLIAGYNNTAYYPSTFNLQHSLTIYNSSSSKFTLTAMSYVSLLVPFVLAYIWYAWRAINNKMIDAEEMKSEGHVY
jgi:cytochrome d ubiquinol oxidase subunit II